MTSCIFIYYARNGAAAHRAQGLAGPGFLALPGLGLAPARPHLTGQSRLLYY